MDKQGKIWANLGIFGQICANPANLGKSGKAVLKLYLALHYEL